MKTEYEGQSARHSVVKAFTPARGPNTGVAPDEGTGGRLAQRDVRVKVQLRGRPFVLHTYLPAEVRPGAPLVLYVSGAGGWHKFDGHIAGVLAGAGMPVCGLSTHSYLKDFYGGSHPATPEEAGADFAALIEQARAVARVDAARPVALVGWSLGAGYVLPAAADARIKPKAFGVVSIAVSRENETVYSLRHALMSRLTHKTYGPRFDAAEYLKAAAPVPVALIQSEGDRSASPEEARGLMAAGRGENAGVHLYVVKGAHDHRFGGRVPEFDRTLLTAFEWMATRKNVTAVRDTAGGLRIP